MGERMVGGLNSEHTIHWHTPYAEDAEWKGGEKPPLNKERFLRRVERIARAAETMDKTIIVCYNGVTLNVTGSTDPEKLFFTYAEEGSHKAN
jgi:hypothetical protein